MPTIKKNGAWDKRAIVYGYSTMADENQLVKVIAATKAMGLHFLSDPDARPDGSAHAEAHLWDNGTDAVAELHHIMEVRKSALPDLEKIALLWVRHFQNWKKVLVPVYHMQRYQVEAAAKWIGGYRYEYGVKGERMPRYHQRCINRKIKKRQLLH